MNYYVDVVSVWRANKVVTLPNLVGWGQTSPVCSLSFLTSFFLKDGGYCICARKAYKFI